MNNLLKTLIFLLVVQTGYLFSQANADFIMAGYEDAIDIYNFRVTTADNGDLDGGFRVDGQNLDPTEIYTCEANFNNGGWYNIFGKGSNADNTNNGETYTGGRLSSNASGGCQINFSHLDHLKKTTTYPDEVDGITMKLRLRTGSTYVPDEDGESFSFDLVRPTLQSVTI